MPSENLNGVSLHFDIVGHGETVVFTHGSWGDGLGWTPTVELVESDFRVVTWDRRGHSRSEDGADPGSIAQDVADLAALIEHVADGPVHAIGNSFGSVIVYRLVTCRPELVASAAVHEPAALALLSASDDPNVQAVAAPLFSELAEVESLLENGQYRDGAAHFIDNVAIGPGSWETFPEESMAALERNASTFLDELREQPYGQLDIDGLKSTKVPLLLTVGTESPEFLKVIANLLSDLVSNIELRWVEGSGHVPHASHPEVWSAMLMDFWNSAE